MAHVAPVNEPPKTSGPVPSNAATSSAVTIRPARVDDAAGVWGLVRDSGVLDVNSPYAYLLGFRHHADTSVVAVDGDDVVGFVLAYRPPAEPESVFVWQVGVAASHRRLGLGRRLLLAVLARQACREVRFLDATVTASNEASLSLFGGVARALDTEFSVSPCFSAGQFPAGTDHEAEDLVRVGPIDRTATRVRQTLEVNL